MSTPSPTLSRTRNQIAEDLAKAAAGEAQLPPGTPPALRDALASEAKARQELEAAEAARREAEGAMYRWNEFLGSFANYRLQFDSVEGSLREMPSEAEAIRIVCLQFSQGGPQPINAARNLAVSLAAKPLLEAAAEALRKEYATFLEDAKKFARLNKIPLASVPPEMR